MCSHGSSNATHLLWLSFIFLQNFANAIDCPSADLHGHALTTSGQSADGSLACTYPTGVCIYISDGELDTGASTDPICPVLAIDNCASADLHGHALTNGGPSTDGSLVCAYPSGVCAYLSTGQLNTGASTSPICPVLTIHSAPPSDPPSNTPSNTPSNRPSNTPPNSASLSTPGNPTSSSPAAPDKPASASPIVITTPPPPQKSSTSDSALLSSSFRSIDFTSGISQLVTDSTSASSPLASASQNTANPFPNSHRNSLQTAAVAGSLGAVGLLLGIAFLVFWCRKRRNGAHDCCIPTQFISDSEEQRKPWDDTVVASVPPRREKQGGAGGAGSVLQPRSGPESGTLSVGEGTFGDETLNLRVRRMEAQLEGILTTGLRDDLPPGYSG
ncbi:hypothetical protein K438DRAFT_1978525 [Mycena galopus ATCC 62051]|nr:hypothetical protein K438DRAFT_1978525 [Mycena galopus ATCC 62051]